MTFTNESVWQPGISSDIFKPFHPRLHIPEIAEMGFKVLEVGCYIPETGFKWQNRHEVEELVKLCEDFNIIIWSAHPPENYPLLLPEESERQKHKDTLKAFADFCKEIGAEYMPVHFWLPKEIFEKVGRFSYFDETLEFLESIYLEYQVMACLETLREPYSAISNQQLLDIVKARQPVLGMIMDTGHAHISDNLHEITRQGKNIIKSLHIHDNDGKDDSHYPPQRGTINWPEFIRDLKNISYQGPIIFEVNGEVEALQQTIDFYNTFFAQY
jgi:sugar phosphate isomerase/epimerase